MTIEFPRSVVLMQELHELKYELVGSYMLA